MENQNVVVVAATEAAPVEVKNSGFAQALFSAQDVSEAIANAPATVVTTKKEKQERATKSASKPKAKTATKAAYSGPLAFVVRGDGARKLFAHTAAWLELTGLIHGKSAPESLIRALGGSALAYHMKQGNFAVSQGMVSLTSKGTEKFLARQQGGHGSYAQEDMEHYMLMMMEGVDDGRLIKNSSYIQPASKYLG